jgi:DNA mismatch endonuclease (patch repair protein)
MSRIRSKDTQPEKSVRKMLRKMKIKFASYPKGLPGKPDIRIKGSSLLIFIHGCFWHQHKGCTRCYSPKSNMNFWRDKLRRNVARFVLQKRLLIKSGWKVFIIWECETKNERALAKSISHLPLVKIAALQ